MRIAITCATGFLGRYLVRQLADAGHHLRCWYRPGSDRSGFENHAADVAQAVELLLSAGVKAVAGQAFNCYDRYVAEQEVARIAKELTGSPSEIADLSKRSTCLRSSASPPPAASRYAARSSAEALSRAPK
jgi:nucleoside-diphosphate-sugar epimerase